jgi:hypothetical protein
VAYVYAFVRQDLPPPQQAIQAAHACIEAARSFISPADEHPHLVLLAVADELQLARVLTRLLRLDVQCKPFHEPDLGHELTALATEPVRGARRRIFRNYQCLRPEHGCLGSNKSSEK